MERKRIILGAAAVLALAALAALPAGLAAHQPVAEAAADPGPPQRGFLGVGIRVLTPELQRHFGAPEGSGVLVASVRDGSPAAAAGIAVGDVITAVDGLPMASARDLVREVENRPGENLGIELVRDRRPLRVEATLGSRAVGHGAAWDRSPEEWAEWAEHWQRWGEEMGERWGRWGEQFGKRLEERYGEEWAEEMAARAERWEEFGAHWQEIGREVERALAEVDWEEIGAAIEESMRSLEEVDWDRMGDEIERRMDELERRLDELQRAREETR